MLKKTDTIVIEEEDTPIKGFTFKVIWIKIYLGGK